MTTKRSVQQVTLAQIHSFVTLILAATDRRAMIDRDHTVIPLAMVQGITTEVTTYVFAIELLTFLLADPAFRGPHDGETAQELYRENDRIRGCPEAKAYFDTHVRHLSLCLTNCANKLSHT